MIQELFTPGTVIDSEVASIRKYEYAALMTLTSDLNYTEKLGYFLDLSLEDSNFQMI